MQQKQTSWNKLVFGISSLHMNYSVLENGKNEWPENILHTFWNCSQDDK